jgi:adenylate cyclase
VTTPTFSVYIPMDRRQALVARQELPTRAEGATLLADISGFTPLAEALTRALGPRRGAEELPQHLNRVYDALITEVDRYGGSVIGFAGDAITCWFSGRADNDAALRAVACALAMQQAMRLFTALPTPDGGMIALALKVGVAAGIVRRFVVGDPQIQLFDVLAGETLDRVAAAEYLATKGEVVLDPITAAALADKIQVVEWRVEAAPDGEQVLLAAPYAVVGALAAPIAPTPWPPLAPVSLTEAQKRPWLHEAVYERLRSGQGDFLAELRPAVALFVRFGGIDYEHDEEAQAKLDRYVRWVQQVIAHYEGTLLQLTIGDKGSYLYAAFGAPIAHDDDAERALAAALELRTPPLETAIRHVQIGISQGRMRVGAYGGATRRTYGVLGDEVNLAARLMSRAPEGQILVSQRVANAVARHFELESVGKISVKGKQDPIPVALVLGRRAPSGQRPASLMGHPLLGREPEVARLRHLLENSASEGGQILGIEGAPGIGKSHLAAELVEQALVRGFMVALGACESTTQASAYAPWRQVFRMLLGLEDEYLDLESQCAWLESRLTAINPDLLLRLPLLGDLLGLSIPDNPTTTAFEPRMRQEALFALAVELIQAWAQSQPLLLMIEDAHWMDEASQGLTLALGRVISQAVRSGAGAKQGGVLLSLTQRPVLAEDQPLLVELQRLPGYHSLSLTDLTTAGIGALVEHRLGGVPSALLLSLIQAQAQGNPFFIEELVEALREAGKLVSLAGGSWELAPELIDTLQAAKCLISEDGAWRLDPDATLAGAEIGLPDSIHGLVLARIDRLPESHKMTLKVASVIGRTFGLDVLVEAHPVQRGETALLLEQIDLLETRDFTRLEHPSPHPTYMFKHHTTQEVAYQTLLETQQRQLHQVVAEVLERSANVTAGEAIEELAYHFSRSDQRDKALHYLDLAARKAQREYANETALAYYKQALALEDRWQWRQGQAEVLHTLGRRDEEARALDMFEAMSGAPPGEVAYLWGQYYEAVGDYAKAQARIEQALHIYQEHADTQGQARCLAQLGLIARRQGNYEQAREWYTQALRVLGDQGAVERGPVFVEIVSGLGTAYRQQANFEEARRCYQQALEISRLSGNRQGEAQALNDLGGMAFYQRDLDGAQQYHRAALKIRRAIGDRAREGTSLYNLALALSEGGDYAQADDYLKAALTLQQTTGNRWEEVNVRIGLGILHHQLGNFAVAQDYLQQGLKLTQTIGDEAGEAYILANLGLVARDQQRLAEAAELFSRGLVLAQAQADPYITSYFLSHLAIVNLQRANPAQAIEQAQAALTMRRENSLENWTTADLATLAAASLALGRVEEARGYAEQTMALLDACGGEGPEAPVRDYMTCLTVFMVIEQPEAARRARQAAYHLVMERANKIKDPELRRSYLERVPINRVVLLSYQAG